MRRKQALENTPVSSTLRGLSVSSCTIKVPAMTSLYNGIWSFPPQVDLVMVLIRAIEYQLWQAALPYGLADINNPMPSPLGIAHMQEETCCAPGPPQGSTGPGQGEWGLCCGLDKGAKVDATRSKGSLGRQQQPGKGTCAWFTHSFEEAREEPRWHTYGCHLQTCQEQKEVSSHLARAPASLPGPPYGCPAEPIVVRFQGKASLTPRSSSVPQSQYIHSAYV